MSGAQLDTSIAGEQDIMSAPVSVCLDSGCRAYAKVDYIAIVNGLCAVGGWQSEPLVAGIVGGGHSVPLLKFSRFKRPDVNEHIGSSPDNDHGFALAFPHVPGVGYEIVVSDKFLPLDLGRAGQGLSVECTGVLGEELASFLWNMLWADQSSQRCGQSHSARVKCGLDHALFWPDREGNGTVFLAGWLAGAADARIYVGDGSRFSSPELHHFFRADIAKAYDAYPNNAGGCGFVCVLNDFPPAAELGVYAEKGGFRTRIADVSVCHFHSYRAFLQAIFEIDLPRTEMAAIYQAVFVPVLSAIQRDRASATTAIQCRRVSWVGAPPVQPQITVIVPLYGTLASLESQAQRFAWDRDFETVTELIYVVADPELLEPFREAVAKFVSSYGFSCRCVHVSTSLSFAEACNLGAQYARGDYIIFVNSDVYPQNPGWSSKMISFLAQNSQAGLVGCRLIYPDGKPQHCGADLTYDPSLQIWGCFHRNDNGDQLEAKIVPYVIGACIAIRSLDFASINGFCTDYLIGNFEDLELCDVIKQMGKEIWYLPYVTMLHIWHQSFDTIGEKGWLGRLWVYNAVVFKNKLKENQLCR